MLNAGHRKGATALRCVVKGAKVEVEELPAYCAVALAGLDDLPDTIMTRSVVIRMRRRAPSERVEPWRARVNAPAGEQLGERLREWSNTNRPAVSWPEMPAGVEDRNADVWEALLAVADLAGGDWPQRGRVAAVSLVAASSDQGGSLGITLLRDLRTIFGDADRLPTETILNRLHQLEESPWADLRGKPLDARSLARRLSKYQVRPQVYRDGESTPRGYFAADLADPWCRYLTPKSGYIPPPGMEGCAHAGPERSETTATTETASAEVAAVALVADSPAPACAECSAPLDAATVLSGATTCTLCELGQVVNR